tara:strand:- start:13 stop:189 length:177 start_codon:yes stop_codon:yes gene_type:complete
MPIANRAKALNLLAWVYLTSPPNLLDLAFKMKKLKTKQKALATSADGNEKVSLLPYLP